MREEEYRALEHLNRSRSQSAVHVSRAKALLAVGSGHSYTLAARIAGYRVGDTVAKLVARFNTEGLNYSTTINIRGESYRLREKRKAGVFTDLPQAKSAKSTTTTTSRKTQEGGRSEAHRTADEL